MGLVVCETMPAWRSHDMLLQTWVGWVCGAFWCPDGNTNVCLVWIVSMDVEILVRGSLYCPTNSAQSRNLMFSSHILYCQVVKSHSAWPGGSEVTVASSLLCQSPVNLLTTARTMYGSLLFSFSPLLYWLQLSPSLKSTWSPSSPT